MHWQAAWDVLSGNERVLAGHAQHNSTTSPVVSELNLFAGHTYAAHGALPDAALTVPAAHAVHGPPSGPENPALHVHTRVEPATEFELAGHAVHGPPSGPENPALHVQAAASAEPVAEFELAGHSEQLVARGLAWNVPGAHSLHAPPSGLVDPASHWHAPTATLPGSDTKL